MANLTPIAGYDPIPQLEKTDRIVGGAGGVSNMQAQALINNIEQVKNDYVAQNEKGVANGIPYLDSDGKVPQSMIPTQGSLRGKWDAHNNIPAITQGSAVVGGETVGNSDYFMVDVAGTWNGIDFIVGDRLMWSEDDGNWFKLVGSSVTSVNGLQGAVIVPNTTVVIGDTTITPNCDERLVVSGGTVHLGNALTQGIIVQIIFIGANNTNISYKNIKGDSVIDTIRPNREIRYVWTGSAWFAISVHAIGETIYQIGMPYESPCLLYGGGWERVYFGGLPLRDAGIREHHTFLVNWTGHQSATIVSGTFPYHIYQSDYHKDLYVAISGKKTSYIATMNATNVTFTSDMWEEDVNPGQTYLSFGIKETLPNLWGVYGASELTEKTPSVFVQGCFYNAGKHTGTNWNSDGNDDGNPYMIGFNARQQNKTWGRGAFYNLNDVTSKTGNVDVYVQTNSIDIYHWKRIY